MTTADAHELAKRDRRIAQLEREVERLGNIVTAQADRLTRIGLPYDEQAAVLWAIDTALGTLRWVEVHEGTSARVKSLRAAQSRLT